MSPTDKEGSLYPIDVLVEYCLIAKETGMGFVLRLHNQLVDVTPDSDAAMLHARWLAAMEAPDAP